MRFFAAARSSALALPLACVAASPAPLPDRWTVILHPVTGADGGVVGMQVTEEISRAAPGPLILSAGPGSPGT